ncbi:unnamed protein product [Protopolystoma xenopodis]|uniref:Uncharacterized protein n=1 Tax=Protopolystoma xenopodis TaxID=117903 RepID=A0A448X0I8_9PLAT|nr:unnamed protein product [Protopolystoma xenopodis]
MLHPAKSGQHRPSHRPQQDRPGGQEQQELTQAAPNGPMLSGGEGGTASGTRPASPPLLSPYSSPTHPAHSHLQAPATRGLPPSAGQTGQFQLLAYPSEGFTHPSSLLPPSMHQLPTSGPGYSMTGQQLAPLLHTHHLSNEAQSHLTTTSTNTTQQQLQSSSGHLHHHTMASNFTAAAAAVATAAAVVAASNSTASSAPNGPAVLPTQPQAQHHYPQQLHPQMTTNIGTGNSLLSSGLLAEEHSSSLLTRSALLLGNLLPSSRRQ